MENYQLNQHQTKADSWKEQLRYAWLNTLIDMWRKPITTLLIIIIIAISLTLPSLYYLIWKNINQIVKQCYPTPQFTVYLDNILDEDAAMKLIDMLKQEPYVDQVSYLSKTEAMEELRNWSGFSSAINLLEDNPLPVVVTIIPKRNIKSNEKLYQLRDQLARYKGIDEVQMEDSWLSRIDAIISLVRLLLTIIFIFIMITVILVINYSIHLSILNQRDKINVMKFIGAADNFILWHFLKHGALLGIYGVLLSIIFSKTLELLLKFAVTKVATVFGINFILYGLSWDEIVLIFLLSIMIGWIAAWFTTRPYLRNITPL